MILKLRTQLLIVLAIFFFTVNVCLAQTPARKKRLHSPATVHGFVGGEVMNNFVIRARKGQTMTVRITWRKEENNTATFSVSPDSDSNSEALAGEQSENGKRWTGKIPKTGNYLITVTAQPFAHYTLRVTIR